MPATEQPGVFVSFASVDKALADEFVTLLRLGCDLDREQIFYTGSPGAILPGRFFPDEIRRNLESSALSFYLLTPAYYRSRFCMAELGASWAIAGDRIPIVVPPVTVADLDGIQLGQQVLRIDRPGDLDVMRQEVSRKLGRAVKSIADWNERKGDFLAEWDRRLKHEVSAAGEGTGIQIAYGACQGHHQEVFWVDAGGQVWHRWSPAERQDQDEVPYGQWSRWTRFEKAPQATGIAVANTMHTLLHVLVATEDGRIDMRSWQRDRGWGSWTTLPAGGRKVTGPLGAFSSSRHHLEVFAEKHDGGRVHRWGWSNEAAGGWSWEDWHDFDPPPPGDSV